jgi:flagellar FliJ protein
VKKFRFSLETVLNVRRQTEELRKRELAAALAERDRTLRGLNLAKSALERALTDHGAARDAKIDLARERWHAGREEALNRQIGALRMELQQKEDALEAARLKAVEASRDRLVLEKLEEKQLEDYWLQLSKEEQGLLDDLAQRSVSELSWSTVAVEGN